MAKLDNINLLTGDDGAQLNRSSTLCQLSYNGYEYNLGVRYDRDNGTQYYLIESNAKQFKPISDNLKPPEANAVPIAINSDDGSVFKSAHTAGETCGAIYFAKKYDDDADFTNYNADTIGTEQLEYYNANSAIQNALSILTQTSVDNITGVVIERLNTWGIPIIRGTGNRVFFDTGATHKEDNSPLGQSLTGILMHIPGHMWVGEKNIRIPNPTSDTMLEEPDTTIEE